MPELTLFALRQPDNGSQVNTTRRVETNYPVAGILAGMAEIGEKVRALRDARGWSQERLAAAAKVSQTTIDNIEHGRTRRSKFLPRIAAALDVSLTDLDPEAGPSALPSQPALVVPRSALVSERDLPVFGSVEGGEGLLIINTEPVDWVRRPSPLLHVREGYGILVAGYSMEPAYRQGDIALVHPLLPPRQEDVVVLYNEGKQKATIKEYRSATEFEWRLRRYHPNLEDFTLERSDWPILHTVVGKYSRR